VSVHLSVCPIYRPLQQRAAGLLLGARRAGDIDRLLHGAPTTGAGRPAATAPQKHGTQRHVGHQQMRARRVISCPTYVAALADLSGAKGPCPPKMPEVTST